MEHPARAHDADLDGVPVVRPAEVAEAPLIVPMAPFV
jgi:hypothetical protein